VPISLSGGSFVSLHRYLPSFLSRSHRICPQARRPRRLALDGLEDRLALNHPLSAMPALHSNPAAPAKLYLDFDGHSEDQWGGWFDPVFGTRWGEWENASTPVFDTDGDRTTFSDGELDAIRDIWARVAEDFAPFHVDVTTVNPRNFADRVGLRVAIGGSGRDWYGSPISGVAIGSSYTDPNHQNTVYVFPDDLSRDTTLIANAAAHEAGHSYGLGHQSTFNALGFKAEEYSTNGGSTVVAPLMGDPSAAARGIWWSGHNTNGDWQDDMAVLASANNGFGFRADDHGDTFAGASGLAFDGGHWSASGIVERTTDRDVFSVSSGGRITVRVEPAARGPDFDATVSLSDGAGTLIAFADPNATDRGDLSAELTATVPPGSYYVAVGSHGGYGDAGQYTVSVFPALAQVASVPVNGGAAQRSHVAEVTVTFSAAVTPPSDPRLAFRLTRTGPGGPAADVALTVDLSASTPARTVARLTFSGPLTEAGSLQDGAYTLRVLSSQVSAGGQPLDGDGDGAPGGDYVLAFHPLYGDGNGDRRVDNADFFLFRDAFGRSAGDPLYLAYFDFNGDGRVDNLDFFQLRARFGTTLP
jgi:hypothetical protein